MGPLEHRGCGLAYFYVHGLGDLANVNRVVVRHDGVEDDSDVESDTGSSGDGDRFVVACDAVSMMASLILGCILRCDLHV